MLRAKYKRCRIVLGSIFFFLAITAVFSGCGGSKFKPFSDVPDANINDEYYENFIERYSRYDYVYSYFVMKNEAAKDPAVYTTESSEFNFYEQVYTEWKEKYPDKVKIIEENSDKLIKMLNRFSYNSKDRHFEKMKEAVDGYIRYVYMDDPAEKDNYETYISGSFYLKKPKELVSQYLSENNIHITHIEPSEYFTGFLYRTYPFKIKYSVKIFYYVGDEEIPENKWKNINLDLEYFIGMDDSNNYVIEYINDPNKYTEQFVEGELMLNDVPTYESENITDPSEQE